MWYACKTLGCLPSDLEDEDVLVIESLLLVDKVIKTKEAEALKHGRN